MYGRWDRKEEDGHVHERVADNYDVRWRNVGYLGNDRCGEDEDEQQNAEVPEDSTRKPWRPNRPLKIVHVTRRLAKMADYPYHNKRQAIYNKAPYQDRDAHIDCNDGDQPAQTLVGPRREEWEK